jgi:ATP-binding cassette, subfamily B, bacterial
MFSHLRSSLSARTSSTPWSDAISPDQIFTNAKCCKIVAQRWQHDRKFKTALASRSRGMCPGEDYRFPPTGFAGRMANLSEYANRPFTFVLRYLRQRLASHVVILTAVVAAVACSVGTQYGVKFLVDGLAAGPARGGSVWLAFFLLMSLITADNFLWRIASWTASFTFVGVTGDLRRDIFRHLTGHAPSYFSDRLPGMLTSRITATSNAVFTVENMFVWNVLPPCIATISAIALIGTVSLPMAAGLIVVAGAMVIAMFHLAAAGKPLHDDFANKAAAVDGEMVDVINNMPLVRAFCGLNFEHDRFDATVNRELTARGRSLRYLEKLRITHAAITVVLTIALLAWAVVLWQRGRATTGDVVLVRVCCKASHFLRHQFAVWAPALGS